MTDNVRELILASVCRHSVDEPNMQDFADVADGILADLRAAGYVIIRGEDLAPRVLLQSGRLDAGGRE